MWLISYARIEILSGIISFIWWFFIHFFKSWTVFRRYIYICKSVLFGFYQRFNLWKIWSLNRSCPLDVETLLFVFKKDVFFSSTGPTIWKLKMSFVYKVIFIYCTSFKKMNLICELKGFLFLFFSHTINRYLTGRVNLVVKTFNF